MSEVPGQSAAGAVGRPGWLAEQLPGALAMDPFLSRFLRIFEEVADTTRERIDGIEHHLDVGLAPPEFVRWLGSWLGVAVDAGLPEARQRDLVRTAGPLLGWRGTKRGLAGLLQALTGARVAVRDGGGVFASGQAPPATHRVIVHLDSTGGVDEQQLLALIEAEVPADAIVTLEVADHMIAARADSLEEDGDEVSDATPEPVAGRGFLPPMLGQAAPPELPGGERP